MVNSRSESATFPHADSYLEPADQMSEQVCSVSASWKLAATVWSGSYLAAESSGRTMQDPTPAPGARQRVLVTGVTGFAGGHLTEALLARGEEVVGLSR